MSSRPDATAITADKWVIEPQKTGLAARAAEFWRYRRVLTFLGSRAVKERYEGTALGMFWLFARPLIPILIAGLVFGRFLGVPSDGVPFIMFFMTGVIPWNLFDRSIMFGTKGLEQHRGLIKKLYFPRLIAPLASMAPAVIDVLIYLGLLIATALFYFWWNGIFYIRASPNLLIGVAMMLLSLLAALGVVLFACVLQTKYRDTRFTLRYVLQFWQLMTPIFYPMSLVPPEYRWLLYVNPMSSIVATFRWAVIGVGEAPIAPLLTSTMLVIASVVIGLWFFTAYESATVDRL